MKSINTKQLINFINKLPYDISNIIRDDIKGIETHKKIMKSIKNRINYKSRYSFYRNGNQLRYHSVKHIIILDDTYDIYKGYYVNVNRYIR